MLWGIQNQLKIFFLRGHLGQLVPQHDVNIRVTLGTVRMTLGTVTVTLGTVWVTLGTRGQGDATLGTVRVTLGTVRVKLGRHGLGDVRQAQSG
jgi:hypothetical protein